MNKRRIEQIRLLVMGALCVPMLLFALLPAQVMPSRAADGTMIMVICSGDGPVQVAIDPATGEPAEGHDQPTDRRCDWAGASPLAVLSPDPVLPAQLRVGISLERAIPSALLAASRATGLPPSTGPPLTV